MDQKMKVYIWDMDETLILLKSLLNGTYARAFNGLKNVKNGAEIGKLWEDHILRVCDEYFFYEQIENANHPYLDVFKDYDDGIDLSEYDFKLDSVGPPVDSPNKRKWAYRFRVIAENYRKKHDMLFSALGAHKLEREEYTVGLYSILSEDVIKLWDSLYDLTDTYTDKWLSSAKTCLEQCVSQDKTNSECEQVQNVNVLVTSGPLIPSLVKCLFFRLDKIFTCDNVYSSLDVGKPECFSWIKERFSGPNVQFCAIGDGWEECGAAECMKWPFVQIDPGPSSIHRFPGLSPADIKHYFSIVYETADEEIESHEEIESDDTTSK